MNKDDGIYSVMNPTQDYELAYIVYVIEVGQKKHFCFVCS